MATEKKIILWVTPEIAEKLPLTRPFDAVLTWDNQERKFLDRQHTELGKPCWESEALLPTGWGREVSSIRVRMLSELRPAITPDPGKLMALLAPGEAEK